MKKWISKKTGININRNINSTISDNTFNNINIKSLILLTPRKENSYNLSLRENKQFNEILIPETSIVNSGIERTKLLNEKMQQLIYYCEKTNLKPTIRAYGYFTSFSTIRQKSDTSDIAKLELLEKENLISMANKGFKIKAIITLDLNKIYKLGYSEELCKERCNDLFLTMKKLEKLPNVEIVFDDCTRLNSLWIFDTLIMFQAFKTNISKQEQNFNSTEIESDFQTIMQATYSFDELFNELKIKKYLNLTTSTIVNI